MDTEVEKNEDAEKPIRRRSSILKMPKARAPLEEIETTETFTDINITKQVRRVSFASSNFVKPFAADPEKNTIWDTTYEEDVNHTNSTQSQSSQNLNSCTKLGSKLDVSGLQVTASSSVHNTTFCEPDIEYANVFSDKENIVVQPQKKFSLVDYAKKLSTNCNPDVHEKTTRLPHGMELTCANLNAFLQSNEKSYHGHQGGLTEISVYNETMKMENTLTDNMEFTCQVPQDTFVKSNHNLTKMNCSMDFTCQLSEMSTTKSSIPMEFTCHDQENVEETQVSKGNFTKTGQTMELTCQTNETHCTTCTMELSCQPPQNSLTKDDANLEVSCQVTQNNSKLIGFPENNLSEIKDHNEVSSHLPQINLTRGDPDQTLDCLWKPKITDIPVNNCTVTKEKSVLSTSNLGKVDDANSFHQVSRKRLMIEDNTNYDVTPVVTVKNEILREKSYCAMEVDQISVDEGCTHNEQATRNMKMESNCQKSQNYMKNPGNLDVTHIAEDICNMTDRCMESSCIIPQNNLTRSIMENKNNSRTSVNLTPAIAETTADTALKENSRSTLKVDRVLVENVDTHQDGVVFDTVKTVSNDSMYVSQNLLTDFTCKSKNRRLNLSVANTNQNESIQMSMNNLIKVDDANSSHQSSHKRLTDADTKSDKNKSEVSVIPSQSMTVENAEILQEKSCSAMEIDQSCDVTNKSLTGVLSTTCESVAHNSTRKPFADMQLTNISQNNYGPVNIPCKIPETRLTTVNDSHSTCQVPSNISIVDDTKFNNEKDKPEVTQMTAEVNESFQKISCPIIKMDNSFLDQSSKNVKFNCTLPNQQSDNNQLDQTRSSSETYVVRERNNIKSDNTRNLEFPEGKSINIQSIEKHFDNEKYRLNQTYLKQQNQSHTFTKNTNVPVSQLSQMTQENATMSHVSIKIQTTHSNTPKKGSQDVSNLQLNYTISATDDTKQLPSLSILDHELSALRTPEQSFHINLTNISSGIDDTQQLLHCTYSKVNPVSFGASRDCSGLMLNTENTENVRNTENTGHVSLPILPDVSACNFEENMEIQRRENKESPDVSVFDIPKHSKLSHINDTYVLKNKKFSKELTEDSYSEEDNSVGIIADDCIQTLGTEDIENAMEELNNMSDDSPPKIRKVELNKVDLKIRRISELSSLLETIEKQRSGIKTYLENFKFRSSRIPEELTIWEKSSCDESVVSTTEEACTICPTVEEKIREHEKSCQKCWKLMRIDGDFYHFSTLYGTLVFVVRLDVETGRVVDIQTTNKLAGNAKPFARYIMKLFLDRFDSHLMKSAIGDHFDMLSLLDYVKMTMLRLHRFQRDFMLCERLKMEEEFIAKFTICSIPLGRYYHILVDVTNIENLNFENDMRIVSQIGAVNEHEVINLAKKCPKRLEFFQSFSRSLEEYLNHTEKKLQKTNS